MGIYAGHIMAYGRLRLQINVSSLLYAHAQVRTWLAKCAIFHLYFSYQE